MALEVSLECFLKDQEGFRFNEGKTRVLCTITGHELPCNVAAIKAYMNGKKYKQLTKNGTCNLSIVANYMKYLVPSKSGKNMLYCGVTKKVINNIPSHIENHVTGRKFQRDLKSYLKLNEECNSKDKSINSEPEKIVEGEDAMEEDEEDEDVEADNESDRNENNGFVGGIWLPDEKDFDKLTVEEDAMDVDVGNLHIDKNMTDAKKSRKTLLKRKVKDNKKHKLSVSINKKKSRQDVM